MNLKQRIIANLFFKHVYSKNKSKKNIVMEKPPKIITRRIVIKITPATLLLFIIVILLLLSIYGASVQTVLDQYRQELILEKMSHSEDKFKIDAFYRYIQNQSDVDPTLKRQLTEALYILHKIKLREATQLKENILGGK